MGVCPNKCFLFGAEKRF